MPQSSWAEQVTSRFFDGRKSPSQMQCDEIVRSVSGAPVARHVESPSSMSYTVVCNGRRGPPQDLIASFREPRSMLDEEMVKLAQKIHGAIVPESAYHGNVEGANPPLSIYSMTYLKGSSCIEASPFEVEMEPNEKDKQEVFIKHLARYFARCWSSPQSIDRKTQAEQQEEIRKRLTRLLQELPSSILPLNSMLSKLVESLPSLFSQDYPQFLTHGDFSVTNILVDENNFEITGAVDWSLAAVMPFEMDLDILFLTTGFMTCDGWHDYACKLPLQAAFWEEFWTVSGIRAEENRSRTRGLAEAACKIRAILRLAFRRNADGSPSNEVFVPESSAKQLRAWLGGGATNLS
ncbi:hypothetical protein EDB81DRAFT_23763 [Dactylonectria macrodidyma]|uniref:Aminoglycoside phosphotransferase domain-containing protein n=1 Tax=Dactylonectria macrodidyma TaxID=307937 RepID=A0A9P9FUW9_9HYPO|nr:hypothetical protein EDB81DRAFT_23763 [Dactylonectria macrodidyma]